MTNLNQFETDELFVKTLERDILQAYQQMGSMIRSTIRSKNDVCGTTTTFEKITNKDNINYTHEPVGCSLFNYYCGDWVNNSEELKTDDNKYRVFVADVAYNFGRKSDELIINEMLKSTERYKNFYTAKFTLLDMISLLNSNNIPDDGRRFCILSINDYNSLTSCYSVSNEVFSWLGVNFMVYPDIDKTIMYHSTAIGHAIGNKVNTVINNKRDKSMHFICSSMKQGATIINHKGVIVAE